MKRTVLIGLTTLVACASPAVDDQPVPASEGGKGDTFQTETKECRYESPWNAETTADLDEFAGSRATFTEADIDSLDEVTANQLFEAVVHLEFLEETERFDLLFGADDDGEMELIELTIDAVQYDWVKFHAGDTEVGVVFANDTADVVAEVSDGDLLTCETVLGPLMTDEPVCSFDQTWRAQTSAEMTEFTRSVEEMDVIDGALSRHKRQIVRAMAHLKLIDANDDVIDAFRAADDERITVYELEFEDGVRFDWVKAYAGDTEVGVVFEDSGSLPIAEVSDGDVMGCTTLVSPQR